MAYSSDFSVCGPRALEFVDVHPAKWANKAVVADWFSKNVDANGFAIYEGDIATVSNGALAIERDSKPVPDPMEIAKKLYTEESNTGASFPPVEDQKALYQDFLAASEHMFMFMDRLKIKSDWGLEFYSIDLGTIFFIDLKARTAGHGSAPGEKRVKCSLQSGFLKAHLEELVHWNNTMISYNLSWMRMPNEYDAAIYKAINFLHKPRIAKAV